MITVQDPNEWSEIRHGNPVAAVSMANLQRIWQIEGRGRPRHDSPAEQEFHRRRSRVWCTAQRW
jgi:hypothetical protein